MIYQVQQFIDDDNRQVVKKVPQEKGNPEYMGMFTVSVPTQFGPQEAQMHFTFPDGYDLEKCFKEFDVLAEAEYEKALAEIREKAIENKIITPDSKGDIIIP